MLEKLTEASGIALRANETVREYVERVSATLRVDLEGVAEILENSQYKGTVTPAEVKRYLDELEKITKATALPSQAAVQIADPNEQVSSEINEQLSAHALDESEKAPLEVAATESAPYHSETSEVSVETLGRQRPIEDGSSVKSFWRLALFAVLLQLGASTLLGSTFVTEAQAFHDNLADFTAFRDVLHAVNYFGAAPWWHPQIQSGFPFYYLWMLGRDGTTPLFSLLVTGVWILGRLGIVITQYSQLYAVYFVYLVPLLFVLSASYLLSRIFTRTVVVVFGILLLAVSPGVVFNLSDIGLLEQTAYGLFLAGALLDYLGSPSRRTFATVAVALVFVSASLNYFALFWNVIFLPVFVATVLLVQPPSGLRRPGWAAWLLPICLLGAAPALAAYLDGDDILRSTLDQRVYDFSLLKAGNLMEPLLSAVPGIGFEWVERVYRPVIIDPSLGNVGYVYLGVTTIPLAIIGLLVGREPWRTRLFILVGFFSVVVPLSAFSPYFAPVLGLPTPLQAVQHYSDVTFRIGGFFLWTVAACLGLEALVVHRTRTLLVTALVLLGANLMLSTVVFVFMYPAEWPASPILGFVVLASGLIAAALWQWLSKGEGEPATQWMVIFLALVFLNVATVGYWHVRQEVWPKLESLVEAPVDQVWSDKSTQAAEGLLTLRQWKDVQRAGLSYQDFQSVYLYPRVVAGSLEEGIAALRRSVPPTLVVDQLPARDQELLRSGGADTNEAPLNGQVKMVQQSYNSTSFSVTVDRPAGLFWRDAYFKGWSVRVGGEERDVLRAFNAFKGVVVPAGTSEVEFVFLPEGASRALMLAYALQFIILCGAVYCWLAPDSRSPPWAYQRKNTAAVDEEAQG